MKNNLKLILLLSSLSLTSIASNASNIIDETITSTSTTQEITTATSSSNQIQQEDPINWDLIAKHRESLKNNNENKNIFKIETELTKTQFNELKEYLNTKFTDHPSTKEILEAIQGLEKSNGLNSQNLLLLSLYHTFKINNNHNETVAKMLTERVLKELYYNLTQTEEVKSMLETSKQLAMFRDGAEFAAPYIFYPIFGVGELSIQDITKAFLDHVFPIGIISEEKTSHNVKVSPGQFAFHDFVHGHQSSIYSYPVTALDYADPETEDTKGLDKIILLTASSTNYIYSLHEKLVKQRKYANKLLKDLIKKADQTKLSGQDRKIFDLMMFYIVHEMNEGKVRMGEIKNEEMFISKMRLFIMGGMFESLDHILMGRTDFRETKKLLEIAGFKEEVLHRCPGKLAFLAIKWYQIACKLMGIEQQMIEKISGLTFDIRELPIYQTKAILLKNPENYDKIDETIKSLESFAKDLEIIQTSQQTN